MRRNKNSGFTMLEVLVVVAITAILLGIFSSANELLRQNKERELAAIQTNVNDAVIGYYGILGIYPIGSSGVAVNAMEVFLTEDQVNVIADELQKYSGFTFIPSVVLERYDFYLYYPNKYVFKIRCEPKA